MLLRFSPKQRPAQAALFSCSSAAAGLLVFGMSALCGHPVPLLPIAAGALLVLGLWFALRFAITSYHYELHGDVLCVVMQIFGIRRTVWTLSLRLGSAIIPSSDRSACKAQGHPYRIHNFLPAWPDADADILYYRDAHRLCAVYLAHNDAFSAAILDRMPK
ncbi:MAG: hypothetical protein J6S76_02850 [Clostridia bacterium]|nr:hypothetical protein [Clostridia bacterium]